MRTFVNVPLTVDDTNHRLERIGTILDALEKRIFLMEESTVLDRDEKTTSHMVLLWELRDRYIEEFDELSRRRSDQWYQRETREMKEVRS